MTLWVLCGLVSLVTCCTGCFALGGWWLVGVVVWLGPAFIRLLCLVGVCRVVFLDGGLLVLVSGGWGWCSCPYFENCIVDASIFISFC